MAIAKHRTGADTDKQSAIQDISVIATLPILTKSQACELLACKPRYLERAIRSGRLRACRPTGKFVRIFRKDLEAFLVSGESMAQQMEACQ